MDIIQLNSDCGSGQINLKLLRKTAMACNNSGGGEIVIPFGRYEIGDEKSILDFEEFMSGNVDSRKIYNDYNVCMAFIDLDGITIDAKGSTFVFEGFIQPFGFKNCKNVIVKNLKIDWKRPGYSEGKVLRVNNKGGYLDVEVFSEYPIKGGEPVISFQPFDVENGWLTGVCPFTDISNIELIEPQVARIRSSDAKYVNPDELLIIRHSYNYRPGFDLVDTHNVLLEDVTFYSLTGMGVVGTRSSDIRFVRFVVRPSKKRIMSITVDGTHFISCFGNISFNDCYFEGMGDDATNVHSMYFKVAEKLDSRTIRTYISHSYLPDVRYEDYPSVGDEIEIVRGDTLKEYHRCVVKSVEYNKDLRETVIRFDTDIPENFQMSDLLANVSKSAYLKFVNCTVKNVRGRAVLLQTRGALVENCSFENCTGQGVHIDTAAPWMEAIGTSDIVIKNNRFINCGYGANSYCDASGVCVETECETPCVGVHKRITIEGNLFSGGNKPAIHIRCADGVMIKDNRLLSKNHAVHLEHSNNIEISGNSFGMDRVSIGYGCDENTVINK